MKFTQTPARSEDRQLWGRCLRGYKNALGTGSIIDPDCREVGIHGQLDFYMSVDELELRDMWRGSNLSTDHPQSEWHHLSDYPYPKINMTGTKFRRGFLRCDAWIGTLRFFLSKREAGIDKQVDVGYVGAASVLGLFALLDKWKSGSYPPSFDLEETIKRAL